LATFLESWREIWQFKKKLVKILAIENLKKTLDFFYFEIFNIAFWLYLARKKKKQKKKEGCDIVVKLLANNGQLSATISNKNSPDHGGKIESRKSA
jgi:hypothetical protein